MSSQCQDTPNAQNKLQRFRHCVYLTSSSSALILVASSLTLPYRQSKRDKLGCDSLCVGYLGSLRSGVGLVGSALVGRWVDGAPSRKLLGLQLGCIATAIAILLELHAVNVGQLYLATLPTILQQNIHLSRAIIGEMQQVIELSTEQRARSSGLLGMSSGIAMMVGPFLGATVFDSHHRAIIASLFILALATVFVQLLQQQMLIGFQNIKSNQLQHKNDLRYHTGSLCILLYKVFSSLSFHMFQTIWASHMQETLNFGPQEYGLFFSIVGLFHALSQGVLAPSIIKIFGNGRKLLSACSLLIGTARFVAFQTQSMLMIYCCFLTILASYGILSTVVVSDTSQVVSTNELATFFGVLGTADGTAGMIGPILSGFLSASVNPTCPLLVIVFLNFIMLGLFGSGTYESAVCGAKLKLKSKLS